MPASSFEADIAAVLAASPKAAEGRLAIIVAALVDSLDDAIDAVGVDAIIAQVNALYDTYVAPADIPWCPDVLEPTLIDMPAKQILAALIRGLHSRVHKD